MPSGIVIFFKFEPNESAISLGQNRAISVTALPLYVFGTTKVAGFNQETMNLKEVVGNVYDSPELLE